MKTLSFFRRLKHSFGTTDKSSRLKKIGSWILGLGIGGALLGLLFFTIVLAWYSRDLPNPNALMDREVPQSTKIYDRTGQILLREIHGDEKRTLVKIEDIPDVMKWATIAVEDKTFYTHHGLNFKRIVSAVLINLVRWERAQGASTLTQQFIKNAILNNEKGIGRKLKEWILAIQLERRYTKDQILQLYFNEIPYGSTFYGIQAASQGYFGKDARELTLDEAALLAAVPQATDYYSPYGDGLRGDNRDKLVQRQHTILDYMAEQNYITKEEAEGAKKIETLKKLQPKRLGDIKAPHFVKYVQDQLEEKYGRRAVQQGGLKVITTLDWDMEQAAEEEVRKGVEARGEKYKFTNGALVAIDPKNGHVLSMVGSKDFFNKDFGQVNVALSLNQPGSSFKPLVFAAGFEKGYTPNMTLWDVNTSFKKDVGVYEPRNYHLDERGPISVRMALQGSLNIPAVKMLYLVGIDQALGFAERLGYTTFKDRSRFGLSLVLGGGDVKLLEHVHAYATLANEGKRHPLTSILKVEDAKGSVLEEWSPSNGDQVVDRDVALTLSDVLSDNGARAYVFNTTNALTLPDRPVAAKTGTTNDFRDAWTVGYTSNLAVGVWVGNNDNTEMKRGADGSVIAAPIWQAFMKRATKNLPKEDFPKPAPLQTTKPILLGKATESLIKIDKISGKLATSFTPAEFIEERTFREAHSELWYIDKDDPAGPPPEHPENDPQFASWEAAVQDWVKRTGWHSTSSATGPAPTEEDDVHTPANQPQVQIISPTANTAWNTRDQGVIVDINAPRIINRIEASMDGKLIRSGSGDIRSFIVHVPSFVSVGYHDLTITAIDDVGNRGSATVNINITAEPAPIQTSITSPVSGTNLFSSSFPVMITIRSEEFASAKKIEVLLEEKQTGDTRLIGLDLAPAQADLTMKWTNPPPSGTYDLYAVLTDQEGQTYPGERVKITVY